MYISDNRNSEISNIRRTVNNCDRDIRTALVYLCASVAAALFGAVYEHFSFGVWSNFMVYAFMIPLAGGAIPYMLRYIRRESDAHERAGFSEGSHAKIRVAGERAAGPVSERVEAGTEWMWHAGIMTLTAGSIVHGILAISGRPNHLTAVYLIAGMALLAAAAIMYVKNNNRFSEGCAGPSAR